jgi:hypothetical protein
MRVRLPENLEDERHLRERYRRLGASRPRIIAALERHRRRPGLRYPERDWPVAMADFVAEHARNAGPTLYYLDFSLEAAPPEPAGPIRRVTVGQALADPKGWLLEGSPTLVSR